MTVSDLTDRLDEISEDLEQLTQIPEQTRNEIDNKISELTDLLGNCSDKYGEDPIEENDEFGEDD